MIHSLTSWWFQTFLIFTPIPGKWSNLTNICSNGLVQPPTSWYCWWNKLRNPANHLKCIKTLQIMGIIYQPQLVHAGFLNHQQYLAPLQPSNIKHLFLQLYGGDDEAPSTCREPSGWSRRRAPRAPFGTSHQQRGGLGLPKTYGFFDSL